MPNLSKLGTGGVAQSACLASLAEPWGALWLRVEWNKPGIPALEVQKPEDQKVKVVLTCIVSPQDSLD